MADADSATIETAEVPPPTNEKPSEDLGEDISSEKNGGLYKKILREGSGDYTTPPGNTVIVHYVGQLTDGTTFDSSRERKEPFEFSLGEGKVIKGWDVGVATMKKGELAVLTCSPEYGYGESGSPPKIPPNATLKFEVEVIDWKATDVTDDGGVKMVVVKKGDGYEKPNDQAEVKVHIVGKHDGRVFEDRHVEFHMGSGDDSGVVEGIELALEKMKKDEKALVTVKSKYGYGSAGSAEHGIPADAILEYVIHLTDFVKAKELYSMSFEEKMEACKTAKEKGNEFFKSGAYHRAVKEYKRIDKIFDSLYEEKEKEDAKPIHLAGFLNLAACHLKLNDHLEAAKACDKAIELDGENVKAHFRRGQARLVLQDFSDAKADFKKVLQLDPKNRAARDQLVVVNQKTAQVAAKERQLYSRMFKKMAKDDKPATTSNAQTESKETKDEKKEEEEEEAKVDSENQPATGTVEA